MELNWSAADGVLGIILVVVVIWAAFKLMKRLLVAFVLVLILAAVFAGVHFGELPFGA